jgi:hypothetical protein
MIPGVGEVGTPVTSSEPFITPRQDHRADVEQGPVGQVGRQDGVEEHRPRVGVNQRNQLGHQGLVPR